MAKVGSKVITTRYLTSRAELTPLPPRVDHVNSVLNNLIAEKLMVLEAADTSSLLSSPNFQAHIRGIKEQAMREALYNKIIEKNVKLDENEIQTAYQTSIREYKLSFYNITDREKTEEIFKAVEDDPEARHQIYEELSQSQRASHKQVKWNETDDPRLFRSLFVNQAEAGDVLMPIRINRNQALIARVEAYSLQPLFSPEDQQIRLVDIRNEYHRFESMVQWKAYTSKLTQGKQIQFEPDAFDRVIAMLTPMYASDTGLIKKEQLDQTAEAVFNDRSAELDAVADNPFFKFDDQVWTIGDFKQAVASHPLMYGQKEIPQEHFPNLFKEAVANLVLDQMLNEEAYKKGYDRLPEVREQSEWWHDAILSQYQLKKTLAARRKTNPSDLPAGLHNAQLLDSLVVELSDKYADQVEIYPEYLDSIRLTRIPLMAYKKNVPYPIAVPSFPYFSTVDTLIFH